MRRGPEAWKMILLIVAAASLHGRVAGADEISPPDLLRIIRENESRYSDFAATSTVLMWNEEKQRSPISTESKRTVQWKDLFYQSTSLHDLSKRSKEPTYRFVVSDGRKKTVFKPPEELEFHSGSFRPPTRFQPYATLLQTLGQTASLSEFLRSDQSTIDGWQINFGAKDVVGGQSVWNVRATRSVPGSNAAKIIDLRLAVDYGLLPCWGQIGEMENNTLQPEIESRVTSFVDTGDRRWLAQEIQTTAFAESSHRRPTTMTLTQTTGEPVLQQPSPTLFELRNITGNPTVRTFVNEKLQSKSKYQPKQIRVEPTPAWLRWLAVNSVLLCIWPFYLICSMTYRLLAQAFKWWGGTKRELVPAEQNL